MPLSVSPAADMVATIRDYLEAEILPVLRDDKWFNVKVAINALATIERELRLGSKANAEEVERLTALLGKTGSLEELNRALARAIRDGSLSIEDARVLDHLRRTTADALAINNPQWPAR
ncbi:MAG TPA: DUF6285 domain-containing protein [Stellaceae bacterium]|nr:DUF6285 domain-containing protein [Stellaceae bacterium]